MESERLGIEHPDPLELGPFCRLRVTTAAPAAPGVYAWTVDARVMYVGRASTLIHIVNGARMQRAYNDYTYVPASKVANQPFSPRVRVNGLLNRAISAGGTARWWWLQTDQAQALESELIRGWRPEWNRQVPSAP